MGKLHLGQKQIMEIITRLANLLGVQDHCIAGEVKVLRVRHTLAGGKLSNAELKRALGTALKHVKAAAL